MIKCIALLFVAWWVFGCSTPQPGQAPGPSLRYGISQAPGSLDPAAETDFINYQIIFNIFETLIAMDWETGAFVPKLATAWQPDSTRMQWTFSLRPRVLFHDGSPLNAEAVKISLERQFDANSPYFRQDQTTTYGPLAFNMIKEIRAVNDSTVQFILKYPYHAFLDNLATPFFATIVSTQALQTFGENFGQHPVGTGPFQFENWIPDRQIVIKQFDRYWGKPPQIAKVTYKIIPSLEARLQQIKSGDVEIISGLSAANVSDLYLTPGVKIVERELLGTAYVGFNCQSYPFSDVKVRQAIRHAVDKKKIVLSICRGLATVAKGLLPPLAADYDSTLVADETYNPTLAEALLKEAGYVAGTKANVHFLIEADSLRRNPLALALKSYLEKMGMQIELVAHQYEPNYRAAILSRNVGQLFWQGWRSYTRHSDSFLYPLFHSQSPDNLFQYKNPEVDALLEQARRTPDRQMQQALYRRIQEIILQDAPAVFFSHPKAVYAIRAQVKNLKVGPLAIPWLQEVRLE